MTTTRTRPPLAAPQSPPYQPARRHGIGWELEGAAVFTATRAAEHLAGIYARRRKPNRRQHIET